MAATARKADCGKVESQHQTEVSGMESKKKKKKRRLERWLLSVVFTDQEGNVMSQRLLINNKHMMKLCM